MTVAARSIDEQITAVEEASEAVNALNRTKVARQQITQGEATVQALRLSAALDSLRWLKTNRSRIVVALKGGEEDGGGSS